ncbi:hypothetical protein HDV00_007694 [Rhizophlyctis rosea]|nr:hypothetical protein HDV00_007694 [Rhizophlyctis rosea]
MSPPAESSLAHNPPSTTSTESQSTLTPDTNEITDIAPSEPRPELTPALIYLFALAGCILVTNTNWNQAILNQMAEYFHVQESDIALIGTLNTVGYALGLLFVTPLGDMVDQRRLILVLCGIVTVLSVVLCFVPWLPVFIVVSFFIGVAACVPQIMIPVAADLAPENARGKAVGVIVSGIMLGVLVSRVVAGLVANYAEWRVVYYLGACLNAAVTVLLYFLIPHIPSHKSTTSYLQLMKSLWKLLTTEVVLQQVAIIGGFGFAAFTLFWTDLTFHLGKEPFSYNSFEIGLFGIIGIGELLLRGWMPGWVRGGRWWSGVDVSERDLDGKVGGKMELEEVVAGRDVTGRKEGNGGGEVSRVAEERAEG